MMTSGEAGVGVDLPHSRNAQTVSFDLEIETDLPPVEWIPVFIHGRADSTVARRQAVFIDVKRQALYATIWHPRLGREIILPSKEGSLSDKRTYRVCFAVSTILGAYSLFLDGELAAQVIESPGDVAGGSLIGAGSYELLNAPGLSISNLETFGEYVAPGVERAQRFSCTDLETQVNLDWFGGGEKMTFCGFMHHKDGRDLGFLPITGVEIEDSRLPLEAIGAERNKIKALINRGEKETVCHGCPRLVFAPWQENIDNKLRTITVNSWTACNLRCEYCFTIDKGTPFIARATYDLLAMFRDLHENGKFDRGASVNWGGGDVTVLVGFEEASSFLTDIGVGQLVNTNAITYSRAIAAGLERGLMGVQVSIDAGSRSLYEAIKGRDHLETVWKNIDRYHRIAKDVKVQGPIRLPYPVVVKYIIYHNNCQPEEILEFTRRCRQHGMRFLTVSAKQGELFPNGRNGHLAMRPDAGAEERILRGVALMRDDATKSQIRTALYTFSPAQERLINQYQSEIAEVAF
jgi:pyruvate-formate lyase-activating enzyme